MSNILKAILNIYRCPIYNTRNHYKSNNRANSMGDALELFVKDSFSNSYELSEEDAIKAHAKTFSYLGNQNNPPDAILKASDAIEVKKIESSSSELALNSSYPKSKLHRDSPMLTASCRGCDGGKWEQKDIIYAVGVINKETIKQLCFVYGEDYAATREIYENLRAQIKKGVLEIPDIEFAETRELGRVNRIDPLGITYLRMRGMWHIQNPFHTFNYIYEFNKEATFNFLAIINEKKYASFPKEDRNRLEEEAGIKIVEKNIKNPNNPALLKKVKVITFSR
ncbi:MAG: NgoPII family restriction endonuclease [Clostridia bacterium]|nr:NgoPII family restriction endonuclease [Clostridia bacterium]